MIQWRTTLTLYHTILSFNDPEKEDFWKHCGKRRKCWSSAFSPFPTMFSTRPKTNFSFWVTFILLSANAFNLGQSINLSFGKELTLYLTYQYFYDPWAKPFWLIDWMVFYAAFNSISVISQQQLTLFISFLGFSSTRLGLWSILPKDTPTKNPRGSSLARNQDRWITSQTLYHWAMQDP